MFNKGTVAMLMCDHSIRALLALDIEDCMGKNEKPGTGSGNNNKKVPVIICLLKTKQKQKHCNPETLNKSCLP